MKESLYCTIALFFVLVHVQSQEVPFNIDGITIPNTKYVLPSGLTLLVHEYPYAPIMTVNMWYHVGSKNEKGEMEHLNAASMEDVQQWFKSYYWAANAVIVLVAMLLPKRSTKKH